jgi:ribosomal protein L28
MEKTRRKWIIALRQSLFIGTESNGRKKITVIIFDTYNK